MLRRSLFVFGFILICHAIATGAGVPVVLAGAGVMGLSTVRVTVRRVPSNPRLANAARCSCSPMNRSLIRRQREAVGLYHEKTCLLYGDPMRKRLLKTHDRASVNGPEWWDNNEKRWIGQTERDARIAGDADPYAVKLTVDEAFGPDVLAPYAGRIAKWKRLHAVGVLTSEQLVERVESPEHNWTDPPAPRAPRNPTKARARNVYDDLVRLEKTAQEALDAIEAIEPLTRSEVARTVILAEGSKREFILEPGGDHALRIVRERVH